jgi:hypothetical protein
MNEMTQTTMKKIALEEHFISPEYAHHVRDLQGKGAGIPAEFEELLASQELYDNHFLESPVWQTAQTSAHHHE